MDGTKATGFLKRPGPRSSIPAGYQQHAGARPRPTAKRIRTIHAKASAMTRCPSRPGVPPVAKNRAKSCQTGEERAWTGKRGRREISARDSAGLPLLCRPATGEGEEEDRRRRISCGAGSGVGVWLGPGSPFIYSEERAARGDGMTRY